MGKERRRAERLDANLFAALQSAAGDDLGRAVVTDVSLSGFAVETEADLQLNTEVSCHIEVPINFKATVVRSLGNSQVRRFGLRIEGQTFWDKIILRRILRGNRKSKKVTL